MAFQHPQYLVDTDWLHIHLEDPTLRMLDCTAYISISFEANGVTKVDLASGRAHWEQGHIPGSGFADLVLDLRDPVNTRFMFPMPPAAQFAAAMSRYGVGEGTHVVLYDDRANMWAARVWWMLRAFGFDHAAVLNGGWKKWTQEGRPVSTAAPQYPAAHFLARPRPALIATQADVLAAIGSERACIIDALPPDQYAGHGPARFGRPGHVPSSVNVSYLGVLDSETHAYLPSEQLRAQYTQAGALHKERVITYCGGGIAACGDALLLTMLGVDNVAVYDGSMTEWKANPTLPLVTGEA